eukprot:146207-Amphidinium_carterae.1
MQGFADALVGALVSMFRVAIEPTVVGAVWRVSAHLSVWLHRISESHFLTMVLSLLALSTWFEPAAGSAPTLAQSYEPFHIVHEMDGVILTHNPLSRSFVEHPVRLVDSVVLVAPQMHDAIQLLTNKSLWSWLTVRARPDTDGARQIEVQLMTQLFRGKSRESKPMPLYWNRVVT